MSTEHAHGEHTPGSDEVLFLPLGGCGEFGLNMNLYGHDGHWLVVDFGMLIDRTRNDALLVPDPSFLAPRRNRLLGLVLTHAHQDHLGAIVYAWKRLECPIYATPFTAAVLRQALASERLIDKVELHVVDPAEPLRLGPFDIEFVNITHSIPEAMSLVIETAAGTILHTGDWKLDEAPVIGPSTDRERFEALGRENVIAMIGDSTNAQLAGATGSEASLYEPLLDLVQAQPGRVLVTCFSSNVARLATLARVAKETGRAFSLVGGTLNRMVAAARTTGYWPGDLEVLKSRHTGLVPREHLLAAATGSQGERNAALSRLAHNDHPQLELDAGDTVIFSSRRIPGNEAEVDQIQQLLRSRGVTVVTEADAHVHVSGHPARQELETMYGWVTPQTAIPVHGTERHQEAHARIAADAGVPSQILGRNGQLLRLGANIAEPVGLTRSGRLMVTPRGLEPTPPQAKSV